MSKRAKQWKFDMQYEAPQIQMIFLLEYMQMILGSTSNLLSVLFLPSSSFLSFSTLCPIESSPPPSTSSSSSSPLSGAPPWRAHLRGFPLRTRLPRQRRPGKQQEERITGEIAGEKHRRTSRGESQEKQQTWVLAFILGVWVPMLFDLRCQGVAQNSLVPSKPGQSLDRLEGVVGW